MVKGIDLRDIHVYAIASQLRIDLAKDVRALGAIQEFLIENPTQQGWVFRRPREEDFYWIQHEAQKAVRSYPFLDEIRDYIQVKLEMDPTDIENPKNYQKLEWIREMMKKQTAEEASKEAKMTARSVVQEYLPVKRILEEKQYNALKSIYLDPNTKPQNLKLPRFSDLIKKPMSVKHFTERIEFEMTKKDVYEILFHCIFDLKRNVNKKKDATLFLKKGNKLYQRYLEAMKAIEESTRKNKGEQGTHKNDSEVENIIENNFQKKIAEGKLASFNFERRMKRSPGTLIQIAKELGNEAPIEELLKDKKFLELAQNFEERWEAFDELEEDENEESVESDAEDKQESGQAKKSNFSSRKGSFIDQKSSNKRIGVGRGEDSSELGKKKTIRKSVAGSLNSNRNNGEQSQNEEKSREETKRNVQRKSTLVGGNKGENQSSRMSILKGEIENKMKSGEGKEGQESRKSQDLLKAAEELMKGAGEMKRKVQESLKKEEEKQAIEEEEEKRRNNEKTGRSQNDQSTTLTGGFGTALQRSLASGIGLGHERRRSDYVSGRDSSTQGNFTRQQSKTGAKFGHRASVAPTGSLFPGVPAANNSPLVETGGRASMSFKRRASVLDGSKTTKEDIKGSTFSRSSRTSHEGSQEKIESQVGTGGLSKIKEEYPTEAQKEDGYLGGIIQSQPNKSSILQKGHFGNSKKEEKAKIFQSLQEISDKEKYEKMTLRSLNQIRGELENEIKEAAIPSKARKSLINELFTASSKGDMAKVLQSINKGNSEDQSKVSSSKSSILIPQNKKEKGEAKASLETGLKQEKEEENLEGFRKTSIDKEDEKSVIINMTRQISLAMSQKDLKAGNQLSGSLFLKNQSLRNSRLTGRAARSRENKEMPLGYTAQKEFTKFKGEWGPVKECPDIFSRKFVPSIQSIAARRRRLQHLGDAATELKKQGSVFRSSFYNDLKISRPNYIDPLETLPGNSIENKHLSIVALRKHQKLHPIEKEQKGGSFHHQGLESRREVYLPERLSGFEDQKGASNLKMKRKRLMQDILVKNILDSMIHKAMVGTFYSSIKKHWKDNGPFFVEGVNKTNSGPPLWYFQLWMKQNRAVIRTMRSKMVGCLSFRKVKEFFEDSQGLEKYLGEVVGKGVSTVLSLNDPNGIF